MTFRDARLPVVLIALALTALTIWSLRYFGRYQPFAELMRPGLPGGLNRISLEVRNATVVGRVGGKRRWRVSCRIISLSRDRRQVTVDGLHDGTLYDERQRAVLSLRAGHAAYAALGEVFGESAPALGTLHLSGGLEAVVLKPNFTLLCDGLTWDALRGQVDCSGAVTARYPGGTATGQDVSVDTHTGDLSLTRLHGVFRVPAEVQMLFRSTPARSALLLGGSLSLLGTTSAAPTPSSAPQVVSYASGFSRWLNAPRTVEMSQGVTFNQDDAFLKANAAIVNLDDQQRALNAKSQSPVHLYNAQDDLTGKQGFIDFTRHLATLDDDIVLIVKPGPKDAATPGSLRSRFKDPATLTCAELTYDYRHKIAHIPGALTVHSGGRVLTADSGEYDAATQTVTLTGHVHGTSGANVINAPHVTINVKEGAESVTINAPTIGTFQVKDDDTASPAVAPEAPPADLVRRASGPGEPLMEIFHGQPAHPGVAIAAAARLRTEYGVYNLDPRRLRRLGERLRSFGMEVPEREQVILVAETVPPGFLLAAIPGLEFVGAAASGPVPAVGGVPCPAVFGLDDTLLDLVEEGDIVIVDGDRGRVYIAPDAMTLARYQAPLRHSRRFFIGSAHLPARTASDDRLVAVFASVPSLVSIPSAIESGADGLWVPPDNDFLGPEDAFQTADEQREILHSLMRQVGGQPVVLHIPPERLAFSALARASAGGDLRLALDDVEQRDELAARLEDLETMLEEQDIPFGTVRFEAGASADSDLPDTPDGFAGMCVTASMAEIGIASLLLLSGLAQRGGLPLTISLLPDDWAETLALALDLGANRVVVPLQALAEVKDAIRAL